MHAEGSRAAERGSALVLALMATLVMTTLGSALVLLAVTETRIVQVTAAGIEALYGADAAIERAMLDLAALPDWDDALAGRAVSGFVDGPPRGVRVFAGARIDLDEATNLLRCGRRAACRDAETTAVTAERPWGANNPRWQLYAWGPLARAFGDAEREPGAVYVVVWVADDPGEVDGDPFRDGPEDDNPGRGQVVLIAYAYGTSGARRAVQATAARADGGDPPAPRQVRATAWREVR